LFTANLSIEELMTRLDVLRLEGFEIPYDFDSRRTGITVRDPWGADESNYYLKPALCQIEIERGEAIKAYLDRNQEIARGALPDPWKPLKDLTHNLLPHLAFAKIDASDRSQVRCLWQVHATETLVDFDDLSSGEPVLASCPYPELRDSVALYREGVSSNNPIHQFLTLWRTYENACEVRGAWRRVYKRPDLKPHEEVIPGGAFGFQGYEGLHFDAVKQKLERPFRVALAHGSNVRDGKPITAASAKDLMSVAYAVPIIRYMAQVTLQNVRATLASSDKSSSGPTSHTG